MKRWTRIALGGALLLATPVAGFQLVQRGWRRDTAALLQRLEDEGLGASPAALGLDGPVADDADALSRASRAVMDLPGDASLYPGTPPAELDALFGPTPPEWWLTYDPETGEQGAPRDAARTIEWILARLDVVEPALDAARGRRGRFPVDWTRGVRVEMPHLLELKALLSALQLRAGWRMRQGDAPGAWLDVERMLGLTARLDDPTIIGRLVRAAMIGITCATIVDLVALGPLPDGEQQARLDAALARLEDPDGYQRALRGELSMLLRTFEVEGGDALDDLDPKGVQRVQLWLTLHRIEREWVEVNGRAIRAAARGTAPERHDALIACAAEAKQTGSTIVNLLLTSFDRAYVKDVDAIARARLARVALRLGARDLPPSASGLPADPWSGAPLLYARDPDGTARVWSVGSNRTDEGGPVPPPGTGGTPSDLVVRLGLPPPPPPPPPGGG